MNPSPFPLPGPPPRPRLFLGLLGVEHELVHVDLANGAQKKPEFLALNPLGQVPVLDDNGTVIADSNAILVYLARDRKSTRLNSSHLVISYAVFCLKKLTLL